MDVVFWVLIGIVGGAALGFIIYYIIKIAKMTPEERKKLLVDWLVTAVNLAESELGSGHGEEKLAEAEAYFKKKAPWLLKIIYAISGGDNLKDLIEAALDSIETNFGKKKDQSTKEASDKEEGTEE